MRDLKLEEIEAVSGGEVSDTDFAQYAGYAVGTGLAVGGLLLGAAGAPSVGLGALLLGATGAFGVFANSGGSDGGSSGSY